MRMGDWWIATWLLLVGACAEGLLEVSMGRFTEVQLNRSTPTEFLLQNIPANVSFIIFQVHSQYVNVTLSSDKIPNRNDSEISSDAGLLNILRLQQTVCTWYVETAYPNPVLVSALTIPYTERDPIPGACNLEFDLDIDPNIYLQYNLYETTIEFAPANLGHARDATAGDCDTQMGQNTRWRLQYDVYQYFLPENNLNESTLIAHLQRMSTISQVSANGKKLATLTSNDRTTMSFSSIPGQGVVYNVIVRDPLLYTSAAYVPVHTYACNFTATMDNCHTLGSVLTKIFFTIFAFLGLFVCFVGHRFLKTGFFFIGFIIFGFLMFVLLTRVTPLNYSDRLALTAFTGVIGGLLLVGYWWRFGFVYICILLVGLVLGFLVSSIVFFTPIGDFTTFRNDTVFWLTFTCIALLVSMVLLPFPRTLNILSCSIVGSYAVVLAIDSYLYTSLSYITLNILKRALNSEFSTVYTSVPFQTNDFIIIALWAVLALSGAVTQFYREREQPLFPPTPYVIWKRDRERRITNILDPIYHTPPLKERFLASLARFRDLFRKEQPLGERTPLLL
ncbi:PREDICTED: transmembrane 7 superfamily member 3 [Nanorana parkeri]|uniref:transmembrane 7 superfamily member 3 n=1 Tax=Nanorana parkeri TaxID=125878 RepID=UPI000854D8A5|nr:PREDICTED: transmembrane 7 superfamily member 3 [Nanorana parkeri]